MALNQSVAVTLKARISQQRIILTIAVSINQNISQNSPSITITAGDIMMRSKT